MNPEVRAETRAAIKMHRALRVNGRIAELHRDRKYHKCIECGLPIVPGQEYYKIIDSQSGILDEIHVSCIHTSMDYGKKQNFSRNHL